MKSNYKHTLIAAYIGYIVQSIVINFPPLLFSIFSSEFALDVGKIGLIISINFITQLCTDLVAARYINKIGYRRGAILSGTLSCIGLLLLGVLPYIMPPFAGIVISTVIMATGGGLTEVIISPIVQSLPMKNKAAHMSLLHSFFCWGFVLTVLVSTVFFVSAGREHWRYLAYIMSAIPLIDAVLFTPAPIIEPSEQKDETATRTLFKAPIFIAMLLFMFCGGASEIAMSQWASYFAETGLSVSKTLGDLLGPCSFALLMGSARVLFAINEKRINLRIALTLSSVLCIISYLTASLSPSPVLALIGCSICGLSVGLMWPGVLSLCAEHFPSGGGKMFALLALAGDIGCVSGPFLLSLVADLTGDLKNGLLFVIIFPIIMLLGLLKERFKNVR